MLISKLEKEIIVSDENNILLVNPKVRPTNAVDLLNAQISLIQNDCQHEYRIIDALPGLYNSLTPGVFIHSGPFKIMCLKCSVVATVSPISRCPRCISEMKLTGVFPEGSEKYTRNTSNGMAPWDGGEKLYTCSFCNLQIAHRISIPYDK